MNGGRARKNTKSQSLAARKSLYLLRATTFNVRATKSVTWVALGHIQNKVCYRNISIGQSAVGGEIRLGCKRPSLTAGLSYSVPGR